MVRQHHQLNGHESEQTPEDKGGQKSLTCYSPWGQKESDTTQQLNNKMNTEQDEVKNSIGSCHVLVLLYRSCTGPGITCLLQVIPIIINGALQFGSLQICLVSKNIKRAMSLFLFTPRDNKCTGTSLVSIRSSFNQNCSQSHVTYSWILVSFSNI